MSDRSFEEEIRSDFIQEAQESLESVEEAFLKLETGDLSMVDEIFRLAHNLKGTAKAVGFEHIANFMHSFENLISGIREKTIPVNSTTMSFLLGGKDKLSKILSKLEIDHGAKVEVSESIESIESYVKTFLSDNGKKNTDQKSVETNLENSKNLKEETLRVSNRKLKNLSDAVGELVIMQSIIKEYSIESSNVDFVRATNQLSKLSKSIQELSMELFMVPVKGTLLKLQRVIRDVAQDLGRPTRVILDGEETEIDKSVLESLYEPLVHIVRNAIDHGLEKTVADRKKSGKPDVGTISISCFHEGGNLIITISDDGRGINPNKIFKLASEKGIVESSADISDREKLNLIFSPGFSTKSTVSQFSGRGVGMDVVMRNVKSLSGDISIQSEVGVGSVFRIRLPLTISVIDGVVGRVAGQNFVFPLNQIEETVLVANHEITYVTGLGHVLNLRGDSIPVWILSDVMGLEADQSPSFSGKTILIAEASGVRFGVAVEKLEKQQQVLVKVLSKEVPNRNIYLGSSILGTGLPALIIDLLKFYQHKLEDSVQKNYIQRDKLNYGKGA